MKEDRSKARVSTIKKMINLDSYCSTKNLEEHVQLGYSYLGYRVSEGT